jgi:hypothetical protein
MLTDSPVLTFSGFCQSISKRFNSADKARAARDKLAKWRQLKSVHVYSQSFLKIILDIPKITEDENIDRYSRGLKTSIWEEVCTHNYTILDELMNDAERVEAAKWRKYQQIPSDQSVRRGDSNSIPTPMELGAVIVGKRTLVGTRKLSSPRALSSLQEARPHGKGMQAVCQPVSYGALIRPKKVAEEKGMINHTPALFREYSNHSVPFSSVVHSAFYRPCKSALVMTGSINGIPCRVLIDSGAEINHLSLSFVRKNNIATKNSNFHEEWVQGMHQALEETSRFEEVSLGSGYSENLLLSIMPLNKYDVIIGKQWLAHFKPSTCMRRNKIEFEFRGKTPYC